MKTFSMNENDKTNETDEQLLKKIRAYALDGFTQSDNDTWWKHNLFNGHHPIIGGGAGSGALGTHPARRHDDVYGKDVNGIGLSPFEPNFGEGTQNESNEGDYAVKWRCRILDGDEELDQSNGLNDWRKVATGRLQEVQRKCKKTGKMLDKRLPVMAWRYFGDDPGSEDIIAGMTAAEEWTYNMNEFGETYKVKRTEHEAGLVWCNIRSMWVTEEDMAQAVATEENNWDYIAAEYDRLYDEKTRVIYDNGIPMQIVKNTNHREINKRAREAGMVRNPRWTKGCIDQPYHIPRGALLTKANIRVCNPGTGKCECEKPILQRVRRVPWGGYEKGHKAKRYGFGRWMNLTITTQSDKDKACWRQKWWGMKKADKKTAIPSISRRKASKAVSWDSVIPGEPKANTPKTETKPEQRVEVQRQSRVVEW